MNRLQTGTDALEYLKSLTETDWNMIDTVVWDPPYFNDEDKERVNQRSKLKDPIINWHQQSTRIMSKSHRQEILDYIRNKNIKYIIHFHMKREYVNTIDNLACTHIWVKPIQITIAGNNDRNNGEFIFIEGEGLKGKIKGRILNKYITAGFRGFLPRACAKPLSLFTKLFNHLGSTGVLDTFAGYGNSIRAAQILNLPVFACDIDKTVNWGTFDNTHTDIDNYFMEVIQ